MIKYIQKYNKYKYKYLDIKNKLYGGGKEDESKDNYIINLIWLNKDIFNSDTTIFNSDKVEQCINLWLEQKHNIIIHVWYDSMLVKQTGLMAIKNKYKDKFVKFVDIHELETVEKYPFAFMSYGEKKIPLYFRVDILKLIIMVYCIEIKKCKYAVIPDIDMIPINKIELFDKETVTNLETIGLVCARGGIDGYENGFNIISDNKYCLEAINYIGIYLNILRCELLSNDIRSFIKNSPIFLFETDKNPIIRCLEQIIYDTYTVIIRYIIHLNGTKLLYIKSDEDCLYDFNYKDIIKPDYEIYNKFKHGVMPFGINHKILRWQLNYVPPTKIVQIPPASLNYDI